MPGYFIYMEQYSGAQAEFDNHALDLTPGNGYLGGRRATLLSEVVVPAAPVKCSQQRCPVRLRVNYSLGDRFKMKMRKKSLYLAAALILLAGMSSAAIIFLAADNPSDNPLVRQFENSKRHRHDLELVGGKMIVLSDRLYRWFDGLWHGKSLAFTVVWISILISGGLLAAAYHLPAEDRHDTQGEHNRGAQA